jgi:predicted RNase H-like HicB family nuclease
MRYAVVIEKAEENYSAYVPDLPGCVATGETVAAVEAEIRDAIRFHVDGMREEGFDGASAKTTVRNTGAKEMKGFSPLFSYLGRKILRRQWQPPKTV